MSCYKKYRWQLVFWLFFLIQSGISFGQHPICNIDPVLFDTSGYCIYGKNKIIPPEVRTQVLIALSYFPELKETEIVFRIKNQLTPLSTKPEFLTLLKGKGNVRFTITISKKSSSQLTPILFFNMPFNAQVGVLGHELSHVADFSNKNILQFCRLAAGHFSGKYIDSREFATDSICIMHGLGFQLLSWSEFVREGLKTEKWLGATNTDTYHPKKNEPERYMNPSTIINKLRKCDLYDRFF